jgi:bile acid:Na+ symporter, BASS family
MSLAIGIVLAFKTSLFLAALGVGLRSRQREALYVMIDARRLSASFVATSVIAPVLALAACMVLGLPPAVQLVLLTLALSPLPALWPRPPLANGDERYAVGLLFASSIFAVAAIPFGLATVARMLETPLQVPTEAVVRTIVGLVVLPLAIGVFLRHVFPTAGAEAAEAAALLSHVVLAAGVVAVVLDARPIMTAMLGDGTALSMVVFALVGLLAGHLLGGRDPDDRRVLALLTASRHPGIALAVAQIAYPDQSLVPAAVALYLVVATFTAAPYAWLRRRTLARNRLTIR